MKDQNVLKPLKQDLLTGESPAPVLLSFSAVWCEPCKWAEPIIADVIEKFNGKIILRKINIDEHPELAREYHVLSVPTMILIKDEKEAWRIRGFDTAQNMIKILEEHL